MKQTKTQMLVYSAIIAALYVALTWLSNAVGMASGAIQVRLSEALCVLPYFTPAAIPGLTIGCLIANLTMASTPLDIVIGSLATLIGAFLTYKIRIKWLCPLPPIISNTILIPFVIMVSYTNIISVEMYFTTALTVFIGEVISVYVFGILLLQALEKTKLFKR